MTCEVCCEICQKKEMRKLSCGCTFCQACLSDYVDAELEKKNLEIMCPGTKCGKPLSELNSIMN